MNNSKSRQGARAMLRIGTAFLLGTFVVTPSLVEAQGGPPQRRAPRADARADARLNARANARGATPDSLRQHRPMRPAAARDNASQRPRNPAASILAQRDFLKLSDDQVNRLNTLSASELPGINEPELLRARADLLEATKGNINMSAARVALDKISRVTNDKTLAELKVRQDARNILTAEQRTQLEARQSGVGRGSNRANVRPRMGAAMMRKPTEFRRR